MTRTATPGLPLPLVRRGKVREVYQLDADLLLLVASDRISAFDVIMREPVPDKGIVLTQLSAWWFQQLADVAPSHFVTSNTDDIIARHRGLEPHRLDLAGRTMLVKRTEPVRFECVVRGYLAGSAWAEYRTDGTLAGEPLPEGLVESGPLAEPIFSPATKAESGHDENVTFATMSQALGTELANRLRAVSLELYHAGRQLAAKAGIIVADTKFEFGIDDRGRLLLIDEILTPDSSRFWPEDEYQPGAAQPSFDKQPVRDYLAGLRDEGIWNGQAPPPPLPAEVVESTAQRYRHIYQRLTGQPLEAT
ncbi:MAG: phosphoribosylaminoimidazolesuccinocarboxamide synthase [Gemmatimonadetes bacterium]|nr:MAG: phosphoribosylaminoimidazolesuccinocarboxamide synthase [Gemmatimonadota bacterium]